MIRWEDAYKVVVAMTPLYVALILGYGSVKWWRVFKPDQCDAVNCLAYYFTLPLFTFEFTSHVDPFNMNYPFVAADAISKIVVAVVIGIWVKCNSSSKRSYCYSWSIPMFCLCTLSNTLVVGAPLMEAMYGQWAVDLVVQSSVVQAILWFPALLFVLEFRRCTSTKMDESSSAGNSSRTQGEDLEGGNGNRNTSDFVGISKRASLWVLMKTVWLKLLMNPNLYACILGLIWAFLSNRFHLKMPSIVEGSVLVMSRAGTGIAMFTMGLFMALQEKLIACGASLALFGMVLKFLAGPLVMAIGAFAVGLQGDVLRVVIIQAALPLSITTFIFAKEYGLHAEVLSTGVIFGTMASLPLLIAFYAALESLD